MAGIFKSIDQSDIRVTPFRSHKLWTDTSVSYGYASNSISPIGFNKLFTQTYNRSIGDNTFYASAIDSASLGDSYIYRIDGDENFALIGSEKCIYVFGEISSNCDKILGFGSDNTVRHYNYDLTLDSSCSPPFNNLPVAYDACYDYNTGNIFAGIQADPNCGGLYEYIGNVDYTAANAVGDYWGVDVTPTNKICTLFRSSSGSDLYLALYNNNSPGTISKGPYIMDPKPNYMRTFFVNSSDTLAIDNFSIWCLFDDNSLYVSSGAVETSILALTDVAEVLLDNTYNISGTYQSQRVHIVTKGGRIYFDVLYDYYGGVLRVGSELDLASYIGIGMGNTIKKASITRNNQWLGLGDPIISITAGSDSNLNETLFVTVNANTQDISYPISMGSLKSNIHLVSDTSRSYATDYTSSINVYTGTFKNNWYRFNY